MKTTTPSLVDHLAKVIGDTEALGQQHEAFYLTEEQVRQLREQARTSVAPGGTSFIFGVPIVLVTAEEQWHLHRLEIATRGLGPADLHALARKTLLELRASAGGK